jgi:DNA-binding transcriptional LysR family regulator
MDNARSSSARETLTEGPDLRSRILPDDFVYFEAVARLGSFTDAANETGVSKSTLSRSVARIEDELAVRLLDRTTRNVVLTAAGEIFFHECSLIVSAMRRAPDYMKLVRRASCTRAL